MRRKLLNALATATLAAAAWLLFSLPLRAEQAQQTCTAQNGATCSGSTCCADAAGCYTDPSICLVMRCLQQPSLPECQA